MSATDPHAGAASMRRLPWESQAVHHQGERYWLTFIGRPVCRLLGRHKDRPVTTGIDLRTSMPTCGHQCLRCWRTVRSGSQDAGDGR